MKKVFLSVFSFFIFVATARAQQHKVDGTVTSAADGQPLPGVNVVVKGTTNGTSTDAKGHYTLQVGSANATLVFSYIGFANREVPVNGRSTIDVALKTDTQMLDEMVVTSFGIEREKKALGYTIQDVKGEEIADTPESDVVDALAGKVAGVSITGGSTGVTSSPRIVIRGESSLSGNNKPLFVVDGIPIDNSVNTQSANSQSAQIDFGSATAQINPDDIKEISVLKGPNAAALYGSRASNGVILITTKSGSSKKGIGVSFSSNVTFSSILKLPDYQNEYGAGSGGQYKFVNGDGTGGGIDGQGYNWGPPLDEGLMITQFGSPRDENGNLVPIPFASHPDNVRNFFETGSNVTNNIAVYGGSDKGNFRLSMTRLDKTGIVPNTDLTRNNISLSSGYKVTDRFKVDANVNYAKTSSDNVPTSGYGSESIMYSFIWWGRHLKTDWLKDYWKPGMEGIEQNNFDNNWTNNIYFQVYENTNSMDKNRLFGNLKASYDFNDQWNLTARTGLDYNDQTTEMRKAFSTRTAKHGRYRQDQNRFQEWNSDFLLTYNKQLNRDFEVKASAGGNHMRQERNLLSVEAPELSVPGIYNIGNSRVNVNTNQYQQEKEINSLYGMAQFVYQDMIFLDVTGRNDWSSTLPAGNNSYFYPSVALSAVVSDILHIPVDSPLSLFKMRLSWAQVGSDTDPYRLRNTYNYNTAWGNIQAVSEAAQIANSQLKPEITTSYEVGSDIRFFRGRLGFDFTYYYNSTRDQILSVPLPESSGYTGRYLNAGEITNQGVELMVNATPIENLHGFTWNVNLNWSRNRSKVVKLAEGIDTYQIANPYGGSVEARVGDRMGDMYGYVFQRDPQGNIIYANGLPLLSESVQKIGNYNPDWMAGIGSSLSWKNITLSVLFDIRHGGRIYSYTHATGIEGGTLTGTTAHRGENIVGDGVVANGDGTYTKNTEPVAYVSWLRRYYSRSNIESNSFDASYVKLRELKIGYTLPRSVIGSLPIQSATVSLIGHNLFLWTDVPHIDPETVSMFGSQQVPGFETEQLPSTRSYGFSIKLNL